MDMLWQCFPGMLCYCLFFYPPEREREPLIKEEMPSTASCTLGFHLNCEQRRGPPRTRTFVSFPSPLPPSPVFPANNFVGNRCVCMKAGRGGVGGRTSKESWDGGGLFTASSSMTLEQSDFCDREGGEALVKAGVTVALISSAWKLIITFALIDNKKNRARCAIVPPSFRSS